MKAFLKLESFAATYYSSLYLRIPWEKEFFQGKKGQVGGKKGQVRAGASCVPSTLWHFDIVDINIYTNPSCSRISLRLGVRSLIPE
jgi:hypothetical protein